MSTQIEKFITSDGRQGEKHITINEDGSRTVVEYVEPRKVLEMNQRTTEKYKTVVDSTVTETIVNGEVVDRKVETHQQPDLKVVEHIAVADPSNKPVSQSDIVEVVRMAIQQLTPAISAQSINQPISAQSINQPISAQSIVEQSVANKKSNWLFYGFVGVAIVIEVGICVWIMI